MAARFLALLRGVNVGRGNRLAMADLRAAVAGCGFTDVSTVLASGNVVLTAPRGTKPAAIASRLERALAESLALRVRATVVGAAALDAIIGAAPPVAATADPSRLLVGFPRVPGALVKLRPLLGRDWSPAVLLIDDAAAWLWCPNGVLAHALSGEVGKATGDELTMRNWATVRKLQAALAPGKG